MKYLFYKDIYYFFRKNFKLFGFYIGVIIFFIFIETKVGVPLTKELFLDALGLNCSLNDNFLIILMYLFNIGSFVLLAILLVKDDITNFSEYIFLRKSEIWWFFNKFISVSLIVLFLKIILYLICYIYFFVNDYIIDGTFELILKDYIYSLLIIVMLFFLCFLLKRQKKLIFSLLVILLLISHILPMNILNIDLFVSFILIASISFILLIMLRKSKISIFEM
ncbi:MAG: hypothetical protein HFJ12_03730 [Bacilli bacterium]|nr:hypothetical protein [Bacilli bacterium]MCI8778250.1 hypothetical protein [Bacilli bacterium]